MAEPIDWTEIQSALQTDGLYTGELDGDPGDLTWKAVNAALAREELAADWENWSAARKKIAVEQAIMHKAGIDTGTIDGLIGGAVPAASLETPTAFRKGSACLAAAIVTASVSQRSRLIRPLSTCFERYRPIESLAGNSER